MGRRSLVTRAVAAAAVVAACAPSSAGAADPGRWTMTGSSTMPLYYYQGITSDPARDLYFDGIDFGLYRSDSQLNEEARNDDVIPPTVTAIECYNPPAGNTCKTGSFGVADPATLRWRYYVKLDPAYIAKAMWAEISPDGQTIWTS